MININLNKLNPLEQKIYEQLVDYSKQFEDIKITQAAELCNCSISKISKFVKKLGFLSYKQFIDFLYGHDRVKKEASSELERIKLFIEEFDLKMVDEFIDLLNTHEKIILFGYGPSFICAQYLEYKLRIASNNYALAVADEISVENMVDQSSLLVIFTTTGSFRSFDELYSVSKEKGCDVLVITEENNMGLISNCDHLFWLCKHPQPSDLKPHEKSRTVFFIFIEEIINRMLSASKAKTQT